MSEITQLLHTAAVRDRRAAADLLPLVYDEVRRLVAARMAAERRGHTLDGALEQLAGAVPVAAELVKLRFFAGMTLRDTADALKLVPPFRLAALGATRAWLADALAGR